MNKKNINRRTFLSGVTALAATSLTACKSTDRPPRSSASTAARLPREEPLTLLKPPPNQTVVLLAVTARADADAEQQSHAAGYYGFLRKPLTGAMLAEAIEALLPEAALE